MYRRRIRVPINSPVWKHYIGEGWIQLYIEGNWATLVLP